MTSDNRTDKLRSVINDLMIGHTTAEAFDASIMGLADLILYSADSHDLIAEELLADVIKELTLLVGVGLEQRALRKKGGAR
jgi:hypothetical protein